MGKKTQTQSMDPMQASYIEDIVRPAADVVAGMEFEPYTGNRTAQLTQLQRDALGGYGALSLPSEIAEATNIYRGMANRTPGERMDRIGAIQDQMAPMLNRQFAQQGVGSQARAIKANAFGDRRDVYEGERQAALDARAYDLANRQLASEDQAAMRSAAALAASGVQGLQSQRDILGAQMAAGETDRALTQADLDAAYNNYLAEMQFPLTQFAALTGGAQAFPAGIGTTTTRDPMGTFGMGLQALGGLGMGGIGPFASFGGAAFGGSGSGLTANPFAFT